MPASVCAGEFCEKSGKGANFFIIEFESHMIKYNLYSRI